MTGVDVVIPSFNYGRFLRDCIQSVLDQSPTKVRVLVIDNASDDDSVEIASEMARCDSRVELLARRRNLGPHASFNEGIDWARSDYFLVLCADDLLVKASLQRAVRVLEERPDTHLAYGRTYFTDRELPGPETLLQPQETCWRFMTGRELIERFCRTGRNHVAGPTAVVRTSVQKAVGYYRPALPHTDDLEMWMRFAMHGNAAETDAWQAISRVHGRTQSATVADIHHWNIEFEAAFRSFFAHEGAALPDARRLENLVLRRLGDRAYCSGFTHLMRGEQGALRLLGYAIEARGRPFGVLPPAAYLLERLKNRYALRSAG